ncbi:2-amino-4-hydroxy-6-hydroxymethyldihydropteridine diphosphokinase [Candidatus Bipolaricaulota bacterium]|nr:2-amino-4-hydroxy-6-hydroxymethyldihydropteridine diphosphokinase [Candidatus Bipolaricaulota bacterium]
MVDAYIGLGSNLGKRRNNIDNSISLLARIGDLKVVDKASFYETEPVGPVQPWFVNTAIRIETDLEGQRILSLCKEVEKRIGRIDSLNWGPRLVDLDILLVGSEITHVDSLDVPHPEIQNRRFVLLPLVEINPGLVHPELNIPIEQLLDEAESDKKVIKIT